MCFNASISIFSYLFGFINSLILFKRGYKIEGIFYAFIIQIQLIEYLLWNNNKKTQLNKYLTKIGIILNQLQPYILYLTIIKYSNNIIPLYVHKLMYIFLIINIIYLYINYKLLFTYTIGIPNKIELQWKIHYGKLKKFYILFLLIILILMWNGLTKYKYLNILLVLLTYIGSYIKYNKTKGVGSIWCLYAAYIPFLLNVIYYVDNERQKQLSF